MLSRPVKMAYAKHTDVSWRFLILWSSRVNNKSINLRLEALTIDCGMANKWTVCTVYNHK